ncbi:AP2 domain-containing protein [Micromonospora tarensis]|uniref:AP2/ERF domain-containing protein n=1 Tax=Micromonospora tarensis TaxID=2806100 RepID=A0ABS1YCN3_9ACTN|nr:AP2 domain-containing protein [Micromonospora tarensis]MBM0275132.1 hypothetical protein [Micromonospora tarensis]
MTVEIPLTQGHVALVDDEDAELVLPFTWRAESRGEVLYAVRTVPAGSPVSRYMHKLLTGYDRTDHANGNGLDNRRANLRRATHAQNASNMVAHRDSASRFKGVTWHAQRRRWTARIASAGRYLYLGLFDDDEAAARAYDERARELFGEFAAVNFPRPGERSALRGAA